MQNRRDQVPQVGLNQVPDDHTIDYCSPGNIQIKSPEGQLIDNELEWEFVAYDRSAGKVIVALFVSDDVEGAKIRLHKLFPNVRISDVPVWKSMFLIAPPSNIFTEGWMLMPVGSDAHSTFGMLASQSYLAKLLEVAQE